MKGSETLRSIVASKESFFIITTLQTIPAMYFCRRNSVTGSILYFNYYELLFDVVEHWQRVSFIILENSLHTSQHSTAFINTY